MKRCLMLLVLALTPFSAARADVDLDRELPRGRPAGSQTLADVLVTKPPLDLSPGFPAIANQGPLGGCQSFAMAAWLDYLFYFKTGHVIDISEKQLAFKLLSFMTEEFWDSGSQSYPSTYLGQSFFSVRPYLGSGFAPFMLAAYFKGYAIPDALYSFGSLGASDGSVGLDFDAFNTYFGDSALPHTKDEYAAALPLAFLTAPPERFVYNLNGTNFSTGAPEILTVKSPKDLADLIGIDTSNVVSLYNLDYRGYRDPMEPPGAQALMNYLVQISGHFGQQGRAVSSAQLMDTLRRSLDQRQAVMIAADVWMGDWPSGLPMAKGGGHAMVVVGYQDRTDGTYFKLRNSWGADHLIRGYDYVSAELLAANTLYLVAVNPAESILSWSL